MSTTTSYGGYTVPILADTDNVPAAMLTYANQIEPRLNKNFASAAARSTALTAAGLTTGTQLRGMRTWLDSPGHEEIHDGTNWRVPAFLEKVAAGGTSINEANGGAVPAATAGFQITGGTRVVTCGPGGGWVFNYGITFPTGLLTLVLTSGDSNSDVTLTLIRAQCGNTQCGGAAFIGGSPVGISGLVSINFLAIGW